MAKNNNLTDFLTDVANAIREKDGSTGTINPQNFSDKIKAIQTGVDTSDGNIEPTTVLKGYKGYAKGVAVNGAIETYDGTVEDVVVVYTDCLTFTGEDGEFTLKATNKTWDGTLQWSTDHITWTTLSGTETIQSVGKKLYLRGKANTTFYNTSSYNGVKWRLSAKAGCSGNIQTLLDWESPPTSIPTADCYNSMFEGCTNLTTAPALPATTLTVGCYSRMFLSCTSLTTAPELPAMTLEAYCYSRMFAECFSLTTAPELPAMTLEVSCYFRMFSDCKNLIIVPELPATTLKDNCYSEMFNGCKNLTTAPVLPATTLAISCYKFMFGNCTKLKVNTSSGNKIFTCPSTIPDRAVNDMFASTGGSFTGTPTAGTTYYYTL